MNINEAFQIAVKTRLNKRNWTKYDLAQKADMAESSVYSVFRVGHRVTMVTADKIAEALGVTLALLIKEAKTIQAQKVD